MSGTWYGQSASGTVYILATVLERVDNDLLWYVRDIVDVPVFELTLLIQAGHSGYNLSIYDISNIPRRVRKVSQYIPR